MRLSKIFTKINFFLFMLVGHLYAASDNNDVILGEAGQEAQKELHSSIEGWKWLIPIAILSIGIGFAIFEWRKIQREEKGQDGQILTKGQIAGRIIVAGLAGSFGSFLLLGIFGYMFLGLNLTDTWKTFITEPMKALILGE